MEFSGKVALITGAAHPKGMGYATAKRLLSGGATVIITDLDGDALKVAEDSLGDNAHAMKLDVTDASAIETTIFHIIGRFSKIDILFNNAGVGVGSVTFTDTVQKDWDLSLAVNVKGVADLCQTVLPHMTKAGSGCIINNTSLCGIGALPGIPATYTTSKFAAVGLTKALALEFGSQGIRINAICPGSIKTQMYDGAIGGLAEAEGISFEDAEKLETESIAMKRAGEPEEVAELVAFLASDKASYINGAAIPASGGMIPGL